MERGEFQYQPSCATSRNKLEEGILDLRKKDISCFFSEKNLGEGILDLRNKDISCFQLKTIIKLLTLRGTWHKLPSQYIMLVLINMSKGFSTMSILVVAQSSVSWGYSNLPYNKLYFLHLIPCVMHEFFKEITRMKGIKKSSVWDSNNINCLIFKKVMTLSKIKEFYYITILYLFF